MAKMLASLPAVPQARPGAGLPWTWMLALVLVVPLLNALAPAYEASGVWVAPLAPALALGLAATTLFGWRALPYLLAGAALMSWGWPPEMPTAQDVLAAVTLLAQTAFGGMLLRRSGRDDDLALDTRLALRRLLVAAVACGVLGGLTQVLGDWLWSPDPSLRPMALLTARAVADAASVIIGLPVLLAWFTPRHAERWQLRRRTVAAPLMLLLVLLLLALAGIDDRDRQQTQNRFERDTDVVFARTHALLDAPVQALQALQGAFKSAPEVLSPTQFDSVAQPWVKRALGMSGIGWYEFAGGTLGATRPATGAARVATEPQDSATAADTGRDSARVRHLLGSLPVLPTAASAPARSVLNLPAQKQSAMRAAGQETVAVSPPVALDAGSEGRSVFVLLQSLGTATTPAAVAQTGMAFAIVSADILIAPIIAARSDGLRACLFDTDTKLELRRLSGPAGCEAGSAPDSKLLMREAAFDFAGRNWAMRLSQPARTSGGVWLFALPALCGSALLAVLLAGMTGQVQRVRHQVRSRTDELHHEMEERSRAAVVHERTVHALMDTVQVGVAMVDAHGRIQRVNTAFTEMAGADAQSLHQQLLDDVLLDDEQPAPGGFTRFIQDADDSLMQQSVRLRNAEGRVMPSLVTLRVLRDEGGRANSVVCAVHDLSENLRRRQVEQVLGNVLDLSRSEGQPQRAGQRAGSGAAATQQRLLCISGDTGLDDMLRLALHDRPGIAVVCAHSATEGLVEARSHGASLVLLDIDLPGEDGLGLMRSLSAMGLPIIACSRDLRPQRIDDAFAAGARAYLTMPPEPRELLAVIDDLI